MTASTFRVFSSGNGQVAGTILVAADGLSVTFIPNAPLSPSTFHQVDVSSFSDLSGQTSAYFYSYFTTGN